MLPRYIVRPRPKGGYSLSGPLLERELWYVTDTAAMSYGHHLCRENGGCVLVLDAQGRWLFTESVEAEGSGLRLLNEYRASAT